MNNLELIDTLIKEKKTSIDVHKGILETDNSRRWFHNKMIKECEEHIEILFKIKSELEEYQKLKDKETAKKVKFLQYELQSDPYEFEVECPHCHNTIYDGDLEECYEFPHCFYCGGSLDWSDE